MSQTIYGKYKQVLLNHLDDLDDFMPYIATFQSRLWFTKMIQQYEIFKLAIDRPGHIVELGVYHGESFFHWARLVEAFNIGERETRVIGFDTFSGFPSVHQKDRSEQNQKELGPLAVRQGGFNAGERSYQRIMELAEIFENDHFVPGKKRLELIRGDIGVTVPDYVARNPGLRIALLHLDCDLYEPTRIALEHLYPLVVAGGVVILDEYGQTKFAGESAAFDEYFGKSRPVLHKSHLVSNPSAWFVKEG
jgi:hypothetical protein